MFFFVNDTATTEIYALSLHDALPIWIFRDNYFGHTWGFNDTIDFTGGNRPSAILQIINNVFDGASDDCLDLDSTDRSEEHTSELQSPCNLVCRLLLEKKTTRYLSMCL